jgi:SAM-dependent methyltransferase
VLDRGETPFAYQIDAYVRKKHIAIQLQSRGLRGRLLEIGCGAGSICGYIHRVMPHLETHAVDLNIDNLIAARRYYPALDYAVMDATALVFSDEKIDAVILAEVIEHFPPAARGQALAEIWRVLRPGGLLVVTTPSLEVEARPCSTHRDVDAETHYVDGFHADDLRWTLEDAGFGLVYTGTCLRRWAHEMRNLISRLSYTVYDYNTQAEIVAHLEKSWLFYVYRHTILPMALLLDKIPAPGYHHIMVGQKLEA